MKRLCLCAAIGMLAVYFNGSVGLAFPPFKKAFQDKYCEEGPESLKEAFKEVKCNACHQGKKKKPRNPYGKELEKHLDHDLIKEWKGTKNAALKKKLKTKLLESLDKAFKEVEGVESPSGEGTFGERINNGLLPFIIPAEE